MRENKETDGSRAFARYRENDMDMKRELVEMIVNQLGWIRGYQWLVCTCKTEFPEPFKEEWWWLELLGR